MILSRLRHGIGASLLAASLVVAAAPASSASAATVRLGEVTPISAASEEFCGVTRTSTSPGQFLVVRDAPFDAALTVTYTMVGDAEPGVDHEELPGTVIIEAGASSAVVDIVPLRTSGGGQIIIQLEPSPEVVIDGAARAEMFWRGISGVMMCPTLTITLATNTVIRLDGMCDVHGNVTTVDRVPLQGEVIVVRDHDRGDLAFDYEFRDPDGVRPTVSASATIMDNDVGVTIPAPPMEPGERAEFVVLPRLGDYFLGELTSQEIGAFEGPAPGCGGPLAPPDQVLQLLPGQPIVQPPIENDGLGHFGRHVVRVSAGSLPPGIALDESGALLGAVTSPGAYAFTLDWCQVALDGSDEACVAQVFAVTVSLPATGAPLGWLFALGLALVAVGAAINRGSTVRG